MSVQRVSSDTPTRASRWKYDVFISFRGEDTRRNFTDHLYNALTREGIIAFRDDEELERGQSISLELLQAIEESRFSIIVFSRNYASSAWCLDEIAKVVECKNMGGQNVFPIFYDVDPSAVRKQTGTFKEPFAKYEEIFSENKEKVQTWRNALIEVANLSGWDAKDRHESELIQYIVKDISFRLSPTTLMTFEGLVGMKNRLEELRLLIGTRSNDIRMIGICGMGGIGKTTIARVFYNLFSYQFEGSVFLANVRENSKRSGLVTLQRQILLKILGREYVILDEYDGINWIKRRLRAKKVLVVIDDVDHIEQLNKLVGNHDWFGFGSRIIITTRNKHLLMIHGVDEVYEAKVLNHDEALQLFILKAFKNQQPLEDYLKLSKLVVKYASGLPLALEVLGSFFFGRTIDEWMDTIKRLKRDSNKEILDKLQISFDGLEETEKKIFLDVACFFKGKSREYVTRILDGCGFNPTIGISVLLEKSLITIVDSNELWMHDFLQEMGRQIVKRECIEEPGKRSRLWDEVDIHHVLTKNTGTEIVEAIMLEKDIILEKDLHLSISAKAFSKMINLRLLKIRKVQLPEGLEYLSNELRLLNWDGYPLKSLPSNLQLNKIVELKLCSSRIGKLWKKNKPLNMLKSVGFTDCKSLIKTPDFTEIPNLEELTLRGCLRLCEIHPSLFVHRKIKLIDLYGCSSLETLPSAIQVKSLIRLELSGCSRLKKFPEIMGSMECLMELYLNNTAIKELPLSLDLLAGLEFLGLEGCKNLSSLPSTINGLKSLQSLDLSYCLNLVSLPSSINRLESLKSLSLSGCSKLENVSETSSEAAKRQPLSSIFFRKNLLSFDGCKGLQSQSFLKKSSNPMSLILPSLLANLCYIFRLDLSDCNLGEEAITSDLLGSFISLKYLYLSQNNFVSLPTTINRLSKLRVLKLNSCMRLQILPELPHNLFNLQVNGCVSLETVSNALRLCNSKFLVISSIHCKKLLNGSNEAFSILKEYLKVMSNQSDNRFSMVVPGSEVPEWFKHKSDGCLIKIEKPPKLKNKRKLVGYVVCSNFAFQKIDPALTGSADGEVGLNSASDYSLNHSKRLYEMPIWFEDCEVGQPVFDHLWLIFLSHNLIRENHAVFFINTTVAHNAKFSVRRLGVHPVYENEDFVEFL